MSVKSDAKFLNCFASLTSCIFLRSVVETHAHQVILVCSVRITSALIEENSPHMNVRAVEKGKQGHSFTLSRSRSKAVTIRAACKSATTVSCASILVKSRSLQRITRSSKLSSTKVKRTNRHYAAKVKATKLTCTRTGQVRRLYVHVQRVCLPCMVKRSTTHRLPRNNSSQEPWK